MADRIHLPISNKKIENILMWRDPKATAPIFGGFTVAYLILEWSGYGLPSIIAYGLLLTLGGLLAWNFAAPFIKMQPPIPEFVTKGVTEEDAKKIVEKAIPPLNQLLGYGNQVINGTNLVLSAQVLIALFIIGKISSWISIFTLLYLLVVVAFVAPKVYEMKKDEIDALIAKGIEKLKEMRTHGEKMMKKIPSAAPSQASSRVSGDHSYQGSKKMS